MTGIVYAYIDDEAQKIEEIVATVSTNVFNEIVVFYQHRDLKKHIYYLSFVLSDQLIATIFVFDG